MPKSRWPAETPTGPSPTRFTATCCARNQPQPPAPRWTSTAQCSRSPQTPMAKPAQSCSISRQEITRDTVSRRLAASSATILFALPLVAAAMAKRPHYGGTLRLEIGAAVASLDPSTTPTNPEETAARTEIDSLIYESRDPDGTFSGAQSSGPFRISDWQPAKELALAANEKFSGGRPYVEAIEIAMKRAAKERLLD